MPENRPSVVVRLSDNEISEALEAHHGNLAAVAQDLGVARYTIWNRIKRSPELREARRAACSMMVGYAQESILEEAIAGNLKACELILRYWGKFEGLGPDGDINVNGVTLLSDLMSPQLLRNLLEKGETHESILAGLINDASDEYRKMEEENSE